MSSTAEDVIAELREALTGAVADLEQTFEGRFDGWECREEQLLGGYRQALAKADQHLSSRAVGDGVEVAQERLATDIASFTWHGRFRSLVKSQDYAGALAMLRAPAEPLAALSDRPSDPSVGGEELDELERAVGRASAYCEARGHGNEMSVDIDMVSRLIASARSGMRGQIGLPFNNQASPVQEEC